jgi:5-methylcytosine-specific restriction enzyme A
MDREVVAEFKDWPEKLIGIAMRIVDAASKLEPSDFSQTDPSEEEIYYEGNIVFTLHKKRERNRQLRKKLIKQRSEVGLSCEICGLKKPHLSQPIQESLFEAHHTIPLAEAEEQRTTRLRDLALLCACCHRAIHKIICYERRWFGVLEAKTYLD